jgi:hypothetical protein
MPDLTKIKRYAVAAVFGTDDLGPSAEPPNMNVENTLYESVIQEEGNAVEPIASIITAKSATITIQTKNVDLAMTLANSLDVGANVLDDTLAKALTLTPIVEDGVTEKTITFTRAFFMPDMSYVPSAGEDHVASLTFKALPDKTTKKLYTWT